MIKGIIRWGVWLFRQNNINRCASGSTKPFRLGSCKPWHEDGGQFKRYMNSYIHADKAIFDRGHFSELYMAAFGVAGMAWALKKWMPLLNMFLILFSYLCSCPEDILIQRYYSRSMIRLSTVMIDSCSIKSCRFTHPSKCFAIRFNSLISCDAMVEKVMSILNKFSIPRSFHHLGEYKNYFWSAEYDHGIKHCLNFRILGFSNWWKLLIIIFIIQSSYCSIIFFSKCKLFFANAELPIHLLCAFTNSSNFCAISF